MLENLISEKKEKIDNNANSEKQRIDYIGELFKENIDILQEYMKNKKTSLEDTYNNLIQTIENIPFPQRITKKNGSFKIKDVLEILGIKLGYFKIRDETHKNIEEYVEQCLICPTEKGRKIYEEYKKL